MVSGFLYCRVIFLNTMHDFPISDAHTTFGLHLLLDAYESDPIRLDDMKRIFTFLNTLPDVIGMHKLSSPFVINADETATGKDPGGITGFVLIAESHISIHTFPKRRFFTLDLYSCNNFEEQIPAVLSYIQETFSYGKHELQVVKRGTSYPVENI